jgi:hypothetical protein
MHAHRMTVKHVLTAAHGWAAAAEGESLQAERSAPLPRLQIRANIRDVEPAYRVSQLRPCPPSN